MPRFVKNGPIVPDKLVQELEEDRVVIFCGAGISMGAGLPDFRGLVDHCYTECGAIKPGPDGEEWSWLDRMLGSLEGSHPGRMRATVAELLDITVKPKDLALHQALLKLGRLRGGNNGTRLVTTNFDLLFEQARPDMKLGVEYHSAPILPIPRNDRLASWRSIVYLHGRVEPATHGNQQLVLTSADFGRAYLTDAWAARFVARLFAEFTVLFIGYSLNDPVLRYMTDAFAAEDAFARTGRKRGPAYLFVPNDSKTPDPKPYQLRRLEPIFYRPIYHHRLLKQTLIQWAKTREDYLSSIRTLIEGTALRLPSALEPSDAANLVWAVCGRPDDKGHGAKMLAGVTPLPPMEWLREFEQHDRQTKTAHEADIKLAKDEEREPPTSPAYHIEPLFPSRANNSGLPWLSAPAIELLPWLCAHLQNQKLVDWVVEKLEGRRRAHPLLRSAIRRHLDATPAIADGYRTFWQLVSSEGDWATDQSTPHAMHGLMVGTPAKRDEPWFKQELAAMLKPFLTVSQSYAAASGSAVDPARINTIADSKVDLVSDRAFDVADRINTMPDANSYWARHLDLLTHVLKQVLDLYGIVGQASSSRDPTALQRPSIEPHPQNAHHAHWARLYDLIWRGWQHVDGQLDPAESHAWIALWRQIRYPGFRRLVLAAMASSPHFTAQQKLEVLLNG
ncbi:SIR2 family protein [Sphingomonas sp. MG17]|uniref:SIR2 family protein n=1 Tax=Sphingomonas tagetis TaxID=2949092 RepID=A0A9X2KRT8_9SPHN|nr:SIR2 family protein [Sphingomonas tagetis]MCP3733123.1 SIR2 family protein [Sphingomonas tagetis]